MLRRINNIFAKITGYEFKKKKINNIFWPEEQLIPQTIYEKESDFHKLYEHAQKVTKMKDTDNPLRRQRHYTLNHLFKCADIKNGDICEIGCWRGLSAYQTAHKLRNLNLDTIFHIFDSFEGLSDIREVDEISLKYQNKEKLRTYDSIEFFYPRLIKNGIMVFDDYGCMQFPGAKKAIDNYLKTIRKAFFVPLPSGQSFLVKI